MSNEHTTRHGKRLKRAVGGGLAGLLAAGGLAAAGPAFADNHDDLVEITITIENQAPTDGTLQTPFWLGVHDGDFDLYDRDQPISAALERLAEDGNPEPLNELFAATSTGGQTVVTGPAGPYAPGESATVTFTLNPNDPRYKYLSYSSMVIPSNDAFVANGNPLAHPLFDDDGNFIGEDIVITGEQVLDAGSEVNDEVPGNTAALEQMAPDTGVVEGGVVTSFDGFDPAGAVRVARPAADTTDGASIARISFSARNLGDSTDVAPPEMPTDPTGPVGPTTDPTDGSTDGPTGPSNATATEFEVTITNVSDGIAAPSSTGANNRVATPLAPGVYGVSDQPGAVFARGELDRGEGLEGVAEDGGASDELVAAVAARGSSAGAFAVPVGATDPGPALPGDAYRFTVSAQPGDLLSFATMYVQTNDWFFAPSGGGVALFDDAGNPVSGDITDAVAIYDAGTEVDQPVGQGADQAPRQAGPNTGASESEPIRLVGEAGGFIEVTVAPLAPAAS